METLAKLTKRELKTLFYIGRSLRLKDTLIGKCDKLRTVKEHKSYGYVMLTEDGRNSYLRLESGGYIVGRSCGNGYYEVGIYDAGGELAALYELL